MRYKKLGDQFPDPERRLQAMLFVYRNTVHSTTGRTPSSMFLGRPIRTSFDTLKPNFQEYADQKALKMKLYHDQAKTERQFSPDDQVLYRRKIDPEWRPAVITKRTGDLSYHAQPTSGNPEIRLHADQLRRSTRPRRILARFQ